MNERLSRSLINLGWACFALAVILAPVAYFMGRF